MKMVIVYQNLQNRQARLNHLLSDQLNQVLHQLPQNRLPQNQLLQNPTYLLPPSHNPTLSLKSVTLKFNQMVNIGVPNKIDVLIVE